MARSSSQFSAKNWLRGKNGQDSVANRFREDDSFQNSSTQAFLNDKLAYDPNNSFSDASLFDSLNSKDSENPDRRLPNKADAPPPHHHIGKKFGEDQFDLPQNPLLPSHLLNGQTSRYRKSGHYHPSLSSDGPLEKYLSRDSLSEQLQGKQKVRLLPAIRKIQSDIIEKIQSSDAFTQTMINRFYDDFLEFADSKSQNFGKLNGPQAFWSYIRSQPGQSDPHVRDFFQVYSSKVCLIFILKLRLASAFGWTPKDTHSFSVVRFLNQIFAPNSRRYIDSLFLRANKYSWYIPDLGMLEPIKSVFNSPNQFDPKTFNYIYSQLSAISEPRAETIHSNCESMYFSKFLFTVLDEFVPKLKSNPRQKNYDGGDEPARLPDNAYTENSYCAFSPIRTPLFCGDLAQEISHGWWPFIRQYANRNTHCYASFSKNAHQPHVSFERVFNEGFLLTSLAEMNRKNDPREKASRVASDFSFYAEEIRGGSTPQGSLIKEIDTERPCELYNTMFFSYTQVLKNNSHHHLCHSLQDSAKLLKPNATLICLTNQNLFINSQTERIQSVLKSFEIKAIFNFEAIETKGNLPSFIYVLRYKTDAERISSSDLKQKKNCLHMRFQGAINRFECIDDLTQSLKDFVQKSGSNLPSLYQSSRDRSLYFDCFQDAVVKGKLFVSSSPNSDQITHPGFFQKMISNCIPLDTIIDLHYFEENRPRAGGTVAEKLIQQSFNLPAEKLTKTLLIVHFGMDDEITVEIFKEDRLPVFTKKYGRTSSHIFEISAKHSGLNLNVLTDFFNSSLGRQIIQMSLFNESIQNTKTKLASLLVPRFFSNIQKMPEHLVQGFDLFFRSEDELSKIEPSEVAHFFDRAAAHFNKIVHYYPLDLLGSLNFFRRNLEKKIQSLSESRESNVFSIRDSHLLKMLSSLPTKPLFPNHEEYFFEFNFTHQNDINLQIQYFRVQEAGDQEARDQKAEAQSSNMANAKQPSLKTLKLFTATEGHVAITSHAKGIEFLEILIPHVEHLPMRAALEAISVPNKSSLESFSQNVVAHQRSWKKLQNRLSDTINRLMNDLISGI